MNYIDLLLGLGAGILLTVIVRTITDARREEKEKQRKHKIDVMCAIEAVDDSCWGNRAHRAELNFKDKKIQALESQIKNEVEANVSNSKTYEAFIKKQSEALKVLKDAVDHYLEVNEFLSKPYHDNSQASEDFREALSKCNELLGVKNVE